MSDVPIRLSKLMAQRGLCSRREADHFIERGWVFVDGERVDRLGVKVLPAQVITIDQRGLAEQSRLVTILLNKPIGYVAGQPEKGYRPAVELLTEARRWRESAQHALERCHFEGLAPAGRLDIDSKGLLVFTQDGRLARLLTSAGGELEKEYLVRVEGQPRPEMLELLRHGLQLDGRALLPCRVEQMNPHQLRLVLREGRKRQIRRMCDAVGLTVTGLKRVRIGAVRLGRLPEGMWRFLEPGERF
jgi:23S rRNA pseudouridine2604 synthase